MMGCETPLQTQLFYTDFCLDRRVRPTHPLRRIATLIDFDFSYTEVADAYGDNGNVSIPPPVILKLMLLLVLYNVRSERELMQTLPERLDWLWFLGFDLDTPIPDHSVLSKARKRWGVTVFQCFFERIVWQCVEASLVDGSKLFVDSSLIEANASNNSVVDRASLRYRLSRHYHELERRLENADNLCEARPGAVNHRYVSTTDPEAAIVARGKPKLLYQTHRAVDPQAEVITALEVTRGDVNEAHRLISLWEQHQGNTHRQADTVVADSKYGTIDNFLACHDRGIAVHVPDLKQAATARSRNRGIFPDHRFAYDATTDTYRCPVGETLKRKSHHPQRDSFDYGAPKKVCRACALRPQCTRNKTGRTVKRHVRQTELDRVRSISRSARARRDIKIRQHLMERSFARASRFGFDCARWRGLWRVTIQEYLTAAIQNIEVLMRYGTDPRRRVAKAMREIGETIQQTKQHLRESCFYGRYAPRAVTSTTACLA